MFVLLSHIVFVKERFIFALVCNIVYAVQLFIARAMVVSWMYSSRHHYQALASDRAMMLDEYMCKPPSLRPNLHQHDVVDFPVHAAYRACECLARPRWLTTPRPAHLSAPTADSVMINFSFTVMIINSAVDNFWPNISGEIHPVYFYYILLS